MGLRIGLERVREGMVDTGCELLMYLCECVENENNSI